MERFLKYSKKDLKPQKDKHNLYDRYVRSQAGCYDEALREIKNGQKSSCWMWYVYPTPPWIVNGIERGSFMNQEYSLRTDAQAEAYLEFEADGVNLRKNYIEITIAARDQLKAGTSVRRLFGATDQPKFISSITYFEKISRKIGDKELNDLCVEVLKLIEDQAEESKRKQELNEKRIQQLMKEQKARENEQKQRKSESSESSSEISLSISNSEDSSRESVHRNKNLSAPKDLDRVDCKPSNLTRGDTEVIVPEELLPGGENLKRANGDGHCQTLDGDETKKKMKLNELGDGNEKLSIVARNVNETASESMPQFVNNDSEGAGKESDNATRQ